MLLFFPLFSKYDICISDDVVVVLKISNKKRSTLGERRRKAKNNQIGSTFGSNVRLASYSCETSTCDFQSIVETFEGMKLHTELTNRLDLFQEFYFNFFFLFSFEKTAEESSEKDVTRYSETRAFDWANSPSRKTEVQPKGHQSRGTQRKST